MLEHETELSIETNKLSINIFDSIKSFLDSFIPSTLISLMVLERGKWEVRGMQGYTHKFKLGYYTVKMTDSEYRNARVFTLLHKTKKVLISSIVFKDENSYTIQQNNKYFDFENVEYIKNFVNEFNALISSYSLNVEELING